jgi:hypothetical protein
MELMDSPDSSIPLAQNQNGLQLPDFTGRIEQEGEFPVGRGGFADVWKCVLNLPSGKCKVSGGL